MRGTKKIIDQALEPFRRRKKLATTSVLPARNHTKCTKVHLICLNGTI